MADKEQKSARRCARCGQELNDFTARRIHINLHKELVAENNGDPEYSYLCLDCQQSRYNALAAATSPQLAIFYCCIAFDTPFDIDAVDKTGEAKEAWKAYCDNLRIKKLDEEDGSPLGFLDGVTDITKIFGANLSAGEFNKAIGIELSARKKKPGTAKQRDTWGEKDGDGYQFSPEDFNKLDRLLATYSCRVDKADLVQEHIFKYCAILEFRRDKLLARNKTADAKRLDDMIQANLASENLRRKDAKPMEDVRIDSIVDALEKKGYMKNGKLLSYPQLLEKLRGDNPRYPYTKDVADQMILKIANTTRINDEMPELTELPPEQRIVDDNGEFAKEPTEKEKSVYKDLGLIPMSGNTQKGD